MFKITGLAKNHTFADIGLGLGNAVIQASFTIGCRGLGVEVYEKRCACSMELHRLMIDSVKKSNHVHTV